MSSTHERAGAGALVIGGDYKSLGVVRSLGRRGIPVWVLTDEHLLASWSRYCRRAIPWPAAAEADQVARLLALAREHGIDGWALYPAGEEAAAMLARNRDALAERYRSTVLVPWETLQHAYDKRLTYRLAAELGVDHPLTRYPRDRDDVAAFDGPFPAILKPAVRPTIDRFTIDKAWPAADRATLLTRYDEACRVTDPAAIMIQALVPGGGGSQLSYAALCRAGEPVACVTARRARQWPMDFGRASTFVETIDAPEVEELALRILRALRFDGIVELEFKRDPRDGRLKLLDINPRIWGWHTLGRGAGVDFPYLLWRMVHGEPLARIRGRAGVRWVRALTDVPTALRAVRAGELPLIDYLWSVRPPIECAVLALDDPLPALLEAPEAARVAWGRRLGTAARAPSGAR
ncbi:MAG TPA: ATP-grasp domain-containing protein [Candidatus Limnocylindria bacterium]|nr:ATP-grasp domain-containing protein [Candidatus Limnocylindria bacterium]